MSKGRKQLYNVEKSGAERRGLTSNSFIKRIQWRKEKPMHLKTEWNRSSVDVITKASISLGNCPHMQFMFL